MYFVAAFVQPAHPGHGPIFLNTVACVGDEERLSDCPHEHFSDFHGCAHEEDQGITCVTEIGKSRDRFDHNDILEFKHNY